MNGTARRPYSPDDGVFRVFVSFASNDNTKGDVERFLRDLADMFAKVSGLPLASKGSLMGTGFEFFSIASPTSLPSGEWKQTLNRELARADAFIPILTPSFFNSEWCAREWGAFNKQFQDGGRLERSRSELVIPIHWMQCDLFPPVVNRIQIWNKDRPMRRLRVSNRARYDRELEDLADRLRKIKGRRPARRHDVDIDRALPAFPLRKLDTETAQYLLLRAATTRTRLQDLEKNGGPKRHGYHCYSDLPERWDPYRSPRGGDKEVSQIEQVIEDETYRLSFTRNPAVNLESVGSEWALAQAGGESCLVILSVDAWLLHHQSWKDIIQSVSTGETMGAKVVLVPTSERDKDREQMRALMRDHLRATVGGGSGENSSPGIGRSSVLGRLPTVTEFKAALGRFLEQAPRGGGPPSPDHFEI